MKLSEIKNIVKNSLKEKRGDSTLYHITAMMVTDTRKRNLEEILSDIRAVIGVTIVNTTREKKIGQGMYQTNATVKVDPFPFVSRGISFGDNEVQDLVKEIRKIEGVRVFRVIGSPQRKKL